MFSAILAISSCEMFPIIVFEMPLCSQLKIYTVSSLHSCRNAGKFSGLSGRIDR